MSEAPSGVAELLSVKGNFVAGAFAPAAGGRTVAVATLSTASMPAEKPTSVSVARWAAHSQPELRKIQYTRATISTAPNW